MPAVFRAWFLYGFAPVQGWILRLRKHLETTLLGRLVARYGEDRAGDFAILLAYNALFALFPVMLSLFTLVSLVLRSQDALNLVTSFVRGALPEAAASDILQVLSVGRTNTGLLGLISLLGLLWGSSALFGTMEYAFDHVYRVDPRPFLRQKLMSVVMMIVFAALVVLTLLGASTATLAVDFMRAFLPFTPPGMRYLVAVAGFLISLVAAFLLIYAIFWIVPNRRFRLGQVWRGAALSSVLFVALHFAFPAYLRLAAGANEYGAVFGLSLLLLTWFYLLGQVLLIGVELNAVLEEREAGRTTDDG